MVEDHERAWRPQNRKNGRDGEENGGGLAGGVAAETEAAAASAQLPNDDGVEREEDRAGEEVDGGTVGPHQNVLSRRSSVALPSSAAAATTAAKPRQTVPQLRPPVIRGCGEQASDVHSKYHPARAGWIRDGVVAKGVADGDVAVNGERHGDPDGGVDGGELQDLHRTVQ